MTKTGWTPLGPQAIILDLDGLVVDSEPLHQEAFNSFLNRHAIGYRFEEEEYGHEFVGIPVAQNADYLIQRFHLDLNAEQLLAEREAIFEALIERPSNLKMMPGVIPLLDELEKRGVLAGIASGSPRHQVETMLRGLGIETRLAVVVAGTDVPRTKPAPDVYLRAVQELGVTGEKCIAIEDSATGITAAKAAGLRVIAVPNRFTRCQDLSQADWTMESLDEVKAKMNGK